MTTIQLLYEKIYKSYFLLSSSLWITYSQMKSDMPLLVRGSSDLLLFTISAV